MVSKVNLGIGGSSDVASLYIDKLKRGSSNEEAHKSVYEKRLNNLRALKKKLLLPIPEEKKVSKHIPYVTPWQDGDVFAYKFDSEEAKEKGYYGKYVLFRKVGNASYWPVHVVPKMNLYQWVGDEIPSIDIIDDLNINPFNERIWHRNKIKEDLL